MQKQSISNYILEYCPICLASDFPVIHYPTLLNDHKITGLHVHDCLEIWDILHFQALTGSLKL